MHVDPNAVATWANAITAARILTSPVMFLLIPEDGDGSWFAFAMWFVLCSSDFVDGWLARRQGATSAGAFLDPLADKVLVLGAMFTLVAHDIFPLVPVVIIAVRELGISVYRTLVAQRGVSIPAGRTGKWKTFVQQFCVAFAIWPWFAADTRWLWIGLLWLSVVLALISAAEYLFFARVTTRALAGPDGVSAEDAATDGRR